MDDHISDNEMIGNTSINLSNIGDKRWKPFIPDWYHHKIELSPQLSMQSVHPSCLVAEKHSRSMFYDQLPAVPGATLACGHNCLNMQRGPFTRAGLYETACNGEMWRLILEYRLMCVHQIDDTTPGSQGYTSAICQLRTIHRSFIHMKLG